MEFLKPRKMENGCEYYLAGEVMFCIEKAARQIQESNSVYKELDKLLRHQKRKRCLAMAAWCFNAGCKEQSKYKLRTFFWNRWGNRWWKLADKLKDGK